LAARFPHLTRFRSFAELMQQLPALRTEEVTEGMRKFNEEIGGGTAERRNGATDDMKPGVMWNLGDILLGYMTCTI